MVIYEGSGDSERLFDLRTSFLLQISLLEAFLSCCPHRVGVELDGWAVCP